jgi:UPF0176 protein
MQKIILFYKFYPIVDPDVTRLWQKNLAAGLNLRGRVLISRHGINGTLGGEIEDLKTYVKETKQFAGFKDTEFKWSDGGRDDFPKLIVKVRDEIVSFGASDELRVDTNGVVGGGVHLKPEQVHELVEEHGDDVVFFDGRNAYEAEVGKFKNAVVPDTRTSKDFLRELESDKYAHLKDKKVVTYCTGGIRCEILSSLMRNMATMAYGKARYMYSTTVWASNLATKQKILANACTAEIALVIMKTARIKPVMI